jgi:Cu(I)/Ag(I) efflux system protein CusF
MKAMPGMTAQAPVQSGMIMAHGTGVVTSIDAKAGAVTIHHGPIAQLSWPAMPMAFKASDPSLLKGTRVGQAMKLQLKQMNGAGQLTSITPN